MMRYSKLLLELTNESDYHMRSLSLHCSSGMISLPFLAPYIFTFRSDPKETGHWARPAMTTTTTAAAL